MQFAAHHRDRLLADLTCCRMPRVMPKTGRAKVALPPQVPPCILAEQRSCFRGMARLNCQFILKGQVQDEHH